MFIDSDIGFQAEDILTMLAAEKDIVCGLYPRKEIDWIQVAAAARRGVAPDELHQHTGALVVNTLDGPIEDAGDGLLEVANAGTGFMLIERAVLDGFTDKVAAHRSGDKVFHQFFGTSIDPDSGVGLSEDFHFLQAGAGQRLSGVGRAMGFTDAYRLVYVHRALTTRKRPPPTSLSGAAFCCGCSDGSEAGVSVCDGTGCAKDAQSLTPRLSR